MRQRFSGQQHNSRSVNRPAFSFSTGAIGSLILRCIEATLAGNTNSMSPQIEPEIVTTKGVSVFAIGLEDSVESTTCVLLPRHGFEVRKPDAVTHPAEVVEMCFDIEDTVL